MRPWMQWKFRSKSGEFVAQLVRARKNLHKNHEDHIAGKGMNSMSHHNLVHNFSNASSDENTRCKGSSGARMGKT